MRAIRHNVTAGQARANVAVVSRVVTVTREHRVIRGARGLPASAGMAPEASVSRVQVAHRIAVGAPVSAALRIVKGADASATGALIHRDPHKGSRGQARVAVKVDRHKGGLSEASTAATLATSIGEAEGFRQIASTVSTSTALLIVEGAHSGAPVRQAMSAPLQGNPQAAERLPGPVVADGLQRSGGPRHSLGR